MQYLMLWTPAANEASSRPPTPALMADLGAYMHDLSASTVIAGGLLPLSQGARIEAVGTDAVVTDGPFAEAKELVAGFSIVEAASTDEAVGWARRFVQIHADHGWDGTCEVRPLMPDEPPAGDDAGPTA